MVLGLIQYTNSFQSILGPSESGPALLTSPVPQARTLLHPTPLHRPFLDVPDRLLRGLLQEALSAYPFELQDPGLPLQGPLLSLG